MLITALVSFMVAFFAQAMDPTWAGVPVFMWIGLAAAVLTAIGIVYAVFMEKQAHRPLVAHHNRHAHA